jgi:hypothetical protein
MCQYGIITNITMHQTNAMRIHNPSTRSSGCFHQRRWVGGWMALMGWALAGVSGASWRLYFAIGMPTISITPQTT